MVEYKFTYLNKTFELNEGNLGYMYIDEEHPITGFESSQVLELLNQAEEVVFDLTYYGQPCQNCNAGREEKAKHFDFLEYHFYIFTKEGHYVISNLSKEYTDTSFNRLLKEGKVDNSYIVTVMVCPNCGEYSVEIEQCDV
jgi:hypothetical protein